MNPHTRRDSLRPGKQIPEGGVAPDFRPVLPKLGLPARVDESGHESRIRVLIDLLADDSRTVLSAVKAELLRLDRIAVPALKKAVAHGSPEIRGRARQALLEGARLRAAKRLIRYAVRETHDLECALTLLGQFHSPQRDSRPYRRALDAMGDEVERRIKRMEPGNRRGLALVEYLGGEMGFAGPEQDFHHPDNILLHRAIERRAGMPLTLCAVYSFVARRAGIRSGLLPFPGHVLLRISDGDESMIVDTFGGGKILTETQCLSYLADHGHPYRSFWFRPASDTTMFQRHILNLISSYRLRNRHAEARTLGKVHAVLSNPTARSGN